MDEVELEILRRCLPGDQEFKLYTASEKEAVGFNEWGDKLLDLRERGLLAFPDGLIRLNHQGGPARYRMIGVRRLTGEGHRELRRHDPPSDAVVQVIRAKINHDVADRRRVFAAKYRELTTRSTVSGALHSSGIMLAIDAIVGEEYRERAKILIDTWLGVLAAQHLALTPRVAAMMKADLGPVLDGESSDVKEIFGKVSNTPR